MKRMNLVNTNLYKTLVDNLKRHEKLSETFDCHIIDLDTYYKHELYRKDNIKLLNKAIKDVGVGYSYLALYDNNPVLLVHGTSEENLEKILQEQRLIAGNNFNYGIWFSEVGTGYYWNYPKYISLYYTKPTLRVIESMSDFMEPALGCVLACEEEINLTEFKYEIKTDLDRRVNLEIAHRSLGLPLDVRTTKVMSLENLYK